MLRFIAIRLAHAAAIVILVATLTFLLIHLAPGDPTIALTETPRVPQEIRERIRHDFGLDQPLHRQYLHYVTNLLRGNLGYSFAEHRSVVSAIVARAPNTLLLATAGLAIAFGLGIPIGVIQAWRSNSVTDQFFTAGTLVLYSIPVFWAGLMVQLIFGNALGWLPVSGAIDPVSHAYLSPTAQWLDRVRHLILPGVTLGLGGAAVVARYQRNALLDAVVRDYIRAARGKGLSERTVLFRHALRNALLPVITLFGLALPVLLSGAVLVETVFSWPGMGRLIVSAIGTRDYYVVTGTAIVASTMVVVGNLLADVLYRVADPRLRALDEA